MTTHVSAWFKRGRRPTSLGRQPDPERRGPEIGLTPEVGGCARPNHALTCMVTLTLRPRPTPTSDGFLLRTFPTFRETTRIEVCGARDPPMMPASPSLRNDGGENDGQGPRGLPEPGLPEVGRS